VNASFTLPAIAHIQLQRGQIDEALATYRQAVEINRRAHYADGSAHACRALGEMLMVLGADDEAVVHLGDAAALFAQLEDQANEALMWQRLATIHERRRQFSDARTAWSRVRELQRFLGNLAAEAEAAEGLARTQKLIGAAPEQLIALYTEALELAVRAADRKRELGVRNGLGIIHWQRGAYADALREYEAALRLCHACGDRVHEGLILNSLGATLHRLRRWDEARTALTDAVRVAEAAAEHQLRAYALATLAEVCLASGRVDEARANAEASLALRRELEDRRGEAWMLEHLARIHLERRDPAAAQGAAAAAATAARTVDDPALHAAIARLQVPGALTDFTQP
jgi:tetratricopeptide (TPR) repeat protein